MPDEERDLNGTEREREDGMMKRIFLAGLVLLLLALSPAAGAAQNRETAVGFQLDTVITLTAYCDRQVLEDALAESGKYERLLSRTIEGSDVWRINHAEGETVTVSPETAEILRTAVRISELSHGESNE